MEQEYLCEVKQIESKTNDWVDSTCLHRPISIRIYIVTQSEETTTTKRMSDTKWSHVLDFFIESDDTNFKTVGRMSS
jgi:hypothetical protein